MASAAIYGKPTDELGHLATLTCSVSANANYPATNIQNFHPDEIFLSAAAIGAGVRFVWDHGTAKDLQLFSLHMDNMPAGTVFIVDRNSSNSWPGAMPCNVTKATSPNPGLPLPVGVDLTAVTGYNGATGFRYSSLFVPALAQLLGIGSALWWSTKRVDLRNVRYPVQDGETHPKRVFSTAYAQGRREYRLGVRQRGYPVEWQFNTDAMYAAFLALFRSCQDGSNAFLWWRDPTGTDAMLARFPDDALQKQLPYNRVHQVTLPIEEIACGVAIPTA